MAKRKNIYTIMIEKLSEGVKAKPIADDNNQKTQLETNELNIDLKTIWAMMTERIVKLEITGSDKQLGYDEINQEEFSKTLEKGVTGEVKIGRFDELTLDTGSHEIKLEQLLEIYDEETINIKIEEVDKQLQEQDKEIANQEEIL